MRSSFLKTAFVVGVTGICVAGLIWASAQLFVAAGSTGTPFQTKLAELTLQLAVIVVIGAIAKALFDWGMAQRSREKRKREAQVEFLKRVRAAHIVVQHARDLLKAHRSPKTYGEQLRRLMELRPEVEEISEDLRVSSGLFKDQVEIEEGLEGIVSYLIAGSEEYVSSHEHVEAGHKAGESLASTIDVHGMKWTKDLITAGSSYGEGYLKSLAKVKGAMRIEVYGT